MAVKKEGDAICEGMVPLREYGSIRLFTANDKINLLDDDESVG